MLFESFKESLSRTYTEQNERQVQLEHILRTIEETKPGPRVEVSIDQPAEPRQVPVSNFEETPQLPLETIIQL